MEVGSAEAEAALAAVDRHARAALECWGRCAALSEEGIEHLKQMYASASGAPQEALLGCQRLRLVALSTKVFGLLACTQGEPRAELLDKIATWVAEARCAFGSPERAASWDWVGGLREVRDAAGRGSSVSAGDALAVAAALTAGAVPHGGAGELARAVLGTVHRISSELIPWQERRRCEAIATRSDGSMAVAGAHLGEFGADPPVAELSRVEPLAAHNARQQRRRVVADYPYSRTGAERPAVGSAAAGALAASAEPPSAVAFAPGAQPPAAAAAFAASTSASAATVRAPAPSALVPSDPVPATASSQAASLLFDAPLLGFEEPPRGPPVVRSTAPVFVSAKGPATTQRDIIVQRREYSVWTEEEEVRLIEGHRLYGNQWELLRAKCDLQHRLGTQLREKWRNLVKAGVVL